MDRYVKFMVTHLASLKVVTFLLLATALRKDPSLPFESCCLPVADKRSSRSSNFLLKPLLSNSSLGQSQSQNVAWTYFAVEVPSSAAMKKMGLLLCELNQ
nr:transmembrane protein-related protein [Tanacetum cinerariifolium]